MILRARSSMRALRRISVEFLLVFAATAPDSFVVDNPAARIILLIQCLASLPQLAQPCFELDQLLANRLLHAFP